MFNWLREFYEVRAARRASLREERLESAVCKSCETLQRQLEIANHEKAQLLERLLEKPAEPQTQTAPPINLKSPRTVPWAVRRQMLEAEDRRTAQLMRQAPKPASEVKTEDVADLEKELDVVQTEREAQGNV